MPYQTFEIEDPPDEAGVSGGDRGKQRSGEDVPHRKDAGGNVTGGAVAAAASLDAVFYMVFAVLLGCTGTLMLIWNERVLVQDENAWSQAVRRARSIDFADIRLSVQDQDVLFGCAAPDAVPLNDPMFGIQNAVGQSMQRVVETFQWIETESVGDIEVMLTYEQAWSAALFNSSMFRIPSEKHANPTRRLFENVRFGSVEFHIAHRFVVSEMIAAPLEEHAQRMELPALSELVKVPALHNLLSSSSASWNPEVVEHNTELLLHNRDACDKPLCIGDTRVHYRLLALPVISLLGQVHRTSPGVPPMLVPFTASDGERISAAVPGCLHSKHDLLNEEQQASRARVWPVRIFGFLLLVIAFALVLPYVHRGAWLEALTGEFTQRKIGPLLFGLVMGTVYSGLVVLIYYFVFHPLSIVFVIGALLWLASRQRSGS
ncbi:hypothetical protein FVE85_4527 [Porphyridium purpureum]|uniref:Transmembrane protein n=1 Tax=Porphyridium purpureum TaxID=35688 RepID=A0A5J4YJS7_PORPP|nr:hypothetical protein FVE85_4527 [Porphyridium purpureum]|eukprot:POR6542..scf297_16